MPRPRFAFAALCSLAIFQMFVPAAFARSAGEFTVVIGEVDLTRDDDAARIVSVGDGVAAGDIVRTKSGARAEIELSDGARLRIGPGSRLEIARHLIGDENPKTMLQLFRGKVRNIVERARELVPGTFEVRTETAVIGVRGTDFVAYHQAEITGAIFLEGEGYCYSLGKPDEIRRILAGQTMIAADRFQPPRIRRATPLEMEQNAVDAPSEGAEAGGLTAANDRPSAGKPGPDSDDESAPGDGPPDASAPPPGDAPREAEAPPPAAPESDDFRFSDAGGPDGPDGMEEGPKSFSGDGPRPRPDAGMLPEGFGDLDDGDSIELGFVGEGGGFPEAEGFLAEGDFRMPRDGGDGMMDFGDGPLDFGGGAGNPEDARPDRPFTETAPEAVEDGYATGFSARFFGHGPDADGRWQTIPAGDFAAEILGVEPAWFGFPEAPAFFEFFGGWFSEFSPAPVFWSTFNNDIALLDKDGGIAIGFLAGRRTDFGGGEAGLEGFGSWLTVDGEGRLGVARNPRFNSSGNNALGATFGSFFGDGTLMAGGGFQGAPMAAGPFRPGDLPERLSRTDLSARATELQGEFLRANGERSGRIGVDDAALRRYQVGNQPWFTASVLSSGRFQASENPASQWIIPLAFPGEDGQIWERAYAGNGLEGGIGRMGWIDLATGETGVGGGDFLGATSLEAGTWSLVESWTGIETRRFLAMTRAAGGEESLFALAIPSIELGRTTLSGSRDGFSVRMDDVTFFRHRAGGPDALWASESVTVAANQPPAGDTVLRLTGPANDRVEAAFRLLRWDGGVWAGRVRAGQAAIAGLDGEVRTRFSGYAGGTLNPDGLGGTGTATGIAITDVPFEVSAFQSEVLASGWTAVPLDAEFWILEEAAFLGGFLEGLDSPWTGDGAPFFFYGFYDRDPASPAEIWFSDPLYSAAPDSLDAVTPDGGAYVAVADGLRVDDPEFGESILTGGLGGVFVNPNGGAGILVGEMLPAFVDPEFPEFDTEGYLLPVVFDQVDLPPEFLADDVVVNDAWLSEFWGEGYFSFSGDALWADDVYRASLRIPGRSWGVWQFASAGAYEGPGWLEEDFWTLYLEDYEQGMFWKKGFARYFDFLPEEVVTADGHAAWMNAEEALTGIAGGTFAGAFDPEAHTWQAVERWAGMTTGRFLELAASGAGRERLAELNIPGVEIGRATLAGSSEIMDVRMEDVAFFSRRTGGDPRIWATDRVGGSALEAPEAGHLVELSGGGLSADFEVGQWADGKWDAHVWGDGLLERNDGAGISDVYFEGRAAGRFGEGGRFQGTASGIAEGFHHDGGTGSFPDDSTSLPEP
ncbi:MAG: FecR domain-containing protein [Desulfococcaceae bacterium]